MTKSLLIAEHESRKSFIGTIFGFIQEETETMSKYQYLAHLTEIATEIAKAKRIPADEIFKNLAALPRDKVAEYVKRMV